MGRSKLNAADGKVINITHLRREFWPYYVIWIIYFAWVIVFTSWWMAPPLTVNVLGVELRFALHTVNLISTLIVVLVVKRERFAMLARFGAVGLVASMAFFLAADGITAQYISTGLIGFFMGCVNVSILIPFVFVLNNTEKFYSVVFTNLLIAAFHFIMEYRVMSRGLGVVFSFVMLICGLSCVIFFRSGSLPAERIVQLTQPVQRRKNNLVIVVSCIFALLSKGVGQSLLQATQLQLTFNLRPWNYIGYALGCGAFVLIFALARKSIQVSWKLCFSAYVLSMLCSAFGREFPFMYIPFAVLLGFASCVGMIITYYSVGVIGKKYSSMRFVRTYVALTAVFSAPGLLLGHTIIQNALPLVSALACILSTAVVIVLLAIAPLLDRGLNDSWTRDSRHAEISDHPRTHMEELGLSRREIEVCELLLKGNTMRQIASVLCISYSTVNTYCTSLYRKLGINSRMGLVRFFEKEKAE